MAEKTIKYSELKSWLASQAENTVDTPYEIIVTELTDNDLTGSYSSSSYKGLQKILKDNAYKYVSIKGLQGNITTLGSMAFYGCTNLTSITIPDSVTSIGEIVFTGCNNLQYLDDYYLPTNSGKTFLCKQVDSSTTEFTIRNDCIGIGGSIFYDIKGLKSLTIPNSVISIGAAAFGNCSSLTSINIPDGVTSILNGTFSGCTSLKSITIPDSVTLIDVHAFWQCSSLTSITIPDNVTSIGIQAFSGCTSLASLKLGNGLASIDNQAFYGCASLTSVEVPDSVISIGNNTFFNCTGLTSVRIGNGVTSIGSEAFQNCTSLESMEIGNSVTSFGNKIFYNCSKLASILYSGSAAQWEKISKGSNWNYSVPSSMVITYNYVNIEKLFSGMVTQYNYTTSTVQTIYTPIVSKSNKVIKWYVTNATGDIKYELIGCNDVSITLTNKRVGKYYYFAEATISGETVTSPVVCVDIADINIAVNDRLRVYGSASILGTLSGPTIDGILARLDALEQ